MKNIKNKANENNLIYKALALSCYLLADKIYQLDYCENIKNLTEEEFNNNYGYIYSNNKAKVLCYNRKLGKK